MEQQTNLNCAIPPPARVPPGNRLGRTLQVWAVSPIETERRSLRRRTQTYLRRRSFDAEVSGLCPARCRSAIRCGRPVDLVVMLCPGDDGLALARELRAAYPAAASCGGATGMMPFTPGARMWITFFSCLSGIYSGRQDCASGRPGGLWNYK